ncbi:hypothetical protein ACP4OV_029132 [Aristida adscensionis]
MQDSGMDGHVPPASFCHPSSPLPSFFPTDAYTELDCILAGSNVSQTPLQDVSEVAAGSMDSAVPDLCGEKASAAPALAESRTKRRGRKPGPRTNISHVAAERHRREKLNSRFCELRAAVPRVSRMDKASLLADATAYIGTLRGRVEQLEAKVKQLLHEAGAKHADLPWHCGTPGVEESLDVRMIGPETAAVRLATTTMAAARHAPARLMGALRSLDLPVQLACVSRVGGAATVQDVVVNVPDTLQGSSLRAALLHALQQDEISS